MMPISVRLSRFGDMAFQQKCINKMRDVSNEKARTILYVSHNMNTIRQLCDRVIVLDHGKVVFNGDVEGGISVYMDTVSEKGETKVDLTDKPRHHLANFAMQMTSVELVGKDDCVFERGERLKLKLNWTAKEDRKGVKLIIAIRTPNDNSTVGTSVSKALCDCAVGKDYSVTVALDTAFLAKGKYFFNLIMSQDDGEGNVVILDFIARAFSVDIVEHAAFGYIHYPELEIVE